MEFHLPKITSGVILLIAITINFWQVVRWVQTGVIRQEITSVFPRKKEYDVIRESNQPVRFWASIVAAILINIIVGTVFIWGVWL